ncbi:MAG: alanine racemase [Lentisphaeraceae bacterium]|nr:alanine racemase [Lentisphaeraceae bacterium]
MARNQLEINLSIIRDNYRRIFTALAPLKVMAVLKANAYGLGALQIGRALLKENCPYIGVADTQEALELKDLGVPIHILGDILPDEIPLIVQHGFIAPITSFTQADALNSEALKQNKKVIAHFLIDSGMGRLGIIIDEANEQIRACTKLSHIKFEGIYSHFPFAYGDEDFSDLQVNNFLNLLGELKSDGIEFSEVHMANSDGIHNIPNSLKSPFTMARTGINLYGCFDLEGRKTVDLSQAMTLKSRLVAVRHMPADSTIGYGRTYKLPKDQLVGTVPIGYADGIPIGLSNKGSMIIHGKKCLILGRVSMDYTTVCLDKVPEAQCGDEVICLGEGITVPQWAEMKQSIPYDIICSIGERVERVYI